MTDETVSYDPFDSAPCPVAYDTLHVLRERCPVTQLTSGFFLATRHDDVHHVLRDGGPRVKEFSHEGKMRALGVTVPDDERLTGEIEGPRHTVLRHVLMTALHARLVARAEPFIRTLCERLITAVIANGGGDLVPEYSVPIPSLVFAHVVGLPEDEHDKFRAWSDEVIHGPTAHNSAERWISLDEAHPEFTEYLDALVRERTDNPSDDLISRIVHTDRDGVRLTPKQARTAIAHLIFAGNETTANLIANLLHQLVRQPLLLERLRDERSLVAAAVEESLRVDAPVLIQPRTAVVDTQLRGTRIPEGARVVLSIAAANHDPDHFRDPDRFDVDRANAADHVSFGGGPHFCTGAGLARLEARVAIDTFLDRVAQVEFDGGFVYERIPVFWSNGPRALPVRVTGR
jgi:cytochrome P450